VPTIKKKEDYMKHVIENGPVFTTVRITLDEGEVLKAEPGSMVTMGHQNGFKG
jgi:uncharacterized protein (AIM24 family)